MKTVIFFEMTSEIPFIGRTGGAIPISCESRHEKLLRGHIILGESFPLFLG